MKNVENYLLCVLMMMLICFILSCDKASPTQSEPNVVCFTVYGHSVTLHNFWNNGTSYTKNVGGLISFNATITENNETHTLEWTNIISDLNSVFSFDVIIDGEDYSYPRDKCGPTEEIVFKLNGTLYNYLESGGSRPYPWGYYTEAYDYTFEQYNIFGSKTLSDFNACKNKTTISFVKESSDRWDLLINYYDENGTRIFFSSPDIDISILKNRDIIGEQMSASIPGPIISDVNANTLSDLDLLVERVASPPVPQPTQFLTHNTGNLEVSIFENGNIGHLYIGNVGNGVKFMGSADALYSGGFIMGTESRGSVNGHVGSFMIDDDLMNTVSISGFNSSPPYWDQTTESTFDDGRAPSPFDIIVNQISYSNTGENSVFIQYSLFGSSTTYDDLFVGIFADWDIGNAFENLGGYDESRNMAYQYDSGGTNDPSYYGIVALTGMSGARVTTEGTWESIRDYSFNWITTFLNEPITAPGDYRMWIGSGPFALSVGDTSDVFFAIVAGIDLNDLNVNADAAIQKYNSVFHQ